MQIGNIFSCIPEKMEAEFFERLAGDGGVLIERIISDRHASPEGFWYDQEKNEWVMVLGGSAGLRFEGREAVVILKSGDWIEIPAHVKHRVEWTDPSEKTIWLAVHY